MGMSESKPRLPGELPHATKAEKAERRRETERLKERLDAVTAAAPLVRREQETTEAVLPALPELTPQMVPRLETYTAEHRARVLNDLDRLMRYDRATYERSLAYHTKPVPLKDT